jgi:4-amino-4-deoxy-L-arabinose transferase-like glycosyltransferase
MSNRKSFFNKLIFKNNAKLRISLVVITIISLFFRLFYDALTSWHQKPFGSGDYAYYYYLAIQVSKGHGFINPFDAKPTATHPPLFVIILALFDLIHFGTVGDQIIIVTVIGALTVFISGLIAYEITKSNKKAIFCTGLACIWPGFIGFDRLVLSEPLAILMTAVLLYFSYRYLAHTTFWLAALLGIFAGAVILTRSEDSLMLLILVIPVIWIANKPLRKRFWHTSLCLLACFVVVSPWIVRNILTFKDFDPLSTQLGFTLVNANCTPTYYSGSLGYFDNSCSTGMLLPNGDESVVDMFYRNIAYNFIKAHRQRVPVVILARLGRAWGFYEPFQQVNFNTLEGWPKPMALANLWSTWAILGFLIYGIYTMKKRRVVLLPLVAVLITAALTVMLVGANIRYSAIEEPAIVILGSIGIYECFELISMKLSRKN